MLGSRQTKQKVASIIDEYLSKRINLYAIFQVCDANVITNLDVEMSKYFQGKFKNHFVILNKIDKQSMSTYSNKKHQICKYLKIQPEKLIFISAKNKININQLNKIIHDTLKQIQK
jgi:GTP-binding protein EngB required for normal cell division